MPIISIKNDKCKLWKYDKLATQDSSKVKHEICALDAGGWWDGEEVS